MQVGDMKLMVIWPSSQRRNFVRDGSCSDDRRCLEGHHDFRVLNTGLIANALPKF